MQKTALIIRYVIITVAVLALLGLGSWYFFLKSKTDTTQSSDNARGIGISAPSFTGTTGSTYQNVLAGITGASQQTSPSTQAAGQPPPKIWQISKNPVAGMGFVNDNGTTVVYFVERATGFVFSADPQTGVVTRMVGTLTPKIYDALFAADGSVVLRSLDQSGRVTTFVGTEPTSTPRNVNTLNSTSSLAGITLEPNIVNVAVNPAGREFFYLVVDPKSGLIGIRAPWNNVKQKRVFVSSLAGWRASWLLDGRIILTQNAADNTPGASFELKSDGSLSPIISNVAGLTLLPRAFSSAFLFGRSSQGSLALFAQVDQDVPPVPLPIKTVADKCAWAPPAAIATAKTKGSTSTPNLIAYCAVPDSLPIGDFLNNWYQGITHASDSWWTVDAKEGSAQVLYSGASGNQHFDVERPMVDSSNTYITFMNASNKSLWLLRLTPQNEKPATSTPASLNESLKPQN